MTPTPASHLPIADEDYLAALGGRVRAARKRLGLSRRDLAFESGVSERFLAEVETGGGNPSVLILRQVADAVGLPVEDLVGEAEADAIGLIAAVRGATVVERAELMDRLTELRRETSGEDPRARRVALIGLRGAGKSTLGKAMAKRAGLPFVELNDDITAEAGISISEVFSLYGDAGYRRLEKRCIEAVMARHETCVMAVGGGIVGAAENYDLLLNGFHTVWLQASPEEHMARVRAQGDERPMAGNPRAMDDLRQILAAREKQYARAQARMVTSDKTVPESLETLAVTIHAIMGPEE